MSTVLRIIMMINVHMEVVNCVVTAAYIYENVKLSSQAIPGYTV